MLGIMEEKRIYEWGVMDKWWIKKGRVRVRKGDVEDWLLEIVEMVKELMFCNEIMWVFEMKRLKILVKIDFLLLGKRDVLLKLDLVDGLLNEFSYLCRWDKYI